MKGKEEGEGGKGRRKGKGGGRRRKMEEEGELRKGGLEGEGRFVYNEKEICDGALENRKGEREGAAGMGRGGEGGGSQCFDPYPSRLQAIIGPAVFA